MIAPEMELHRAIDASPFRGLVYRAWHWPPRELEVLALSNDPFPLDADVVAALVGVVGRGGTVLILAPDANVLNRARVTLNALVDAPGGHA